MTIRGNSKRILAYSVLVILIMLVYQYVATIADPTQSALKSGDHNIAIEESFFVDPDSKHSIQQLIDNPDVWIRQPMELIPWGFEQQVYWIRLKLRNNNNTPEELVLHFSNPMLEQLTVFQNSVEGNLDQTKLGWQRKDLDKQSRSIPSKAVTLTANSEVLLYIRIATEGIAKTPIKIYLKDDFSKLVQFTFLIWGSFVGILIVMSLYNLVLYAGLKDGVYLVYIGYTLSILMMLGVVIGFGHFIWPESIIRFLRENIVSVNLSVVIFTLSFALLFFNTLKYKTRIVRYSKQYLIFLFGLLLVCFTLPEYIAAPIFFLSMVFLYPLVFVLLVQQYRINYRWARYYIVSWVPLIIGGAIQPMSLTGVVEESFLTHHALMIGVLFEVVLMAMALANRMQFKKEKALFNATHDPGTRLPNNTLLESNANHLKGQGTNFSICLFQISEFTSLVPYISSNDNDDLMVMLAKSIGRYIFNNELFHTLDHSQAQPKKLAKINDGVLAAIVVLDQQYVFEQQNDDAVYDTLLAIQKNASKGAQIGKLLVTLNVNIGMSLLEKHQEIAVVDIVKQAYQALEQGKLNARWLNFYKPENASSVAQRLSLASSLQQALRANELQLFHQPQMNLDTGQVDGSEALLRWQHKDYGFIPPTEFIKLAEDTGIINELTLWVVNKACEHLQSIIEQGYEQHNVSINISGKDISEPSFLNSVKRILARYDFPLHNLTFELTESVTVSDFELLSKTLNDLSEMGVHIAIDDYGTGYSSLFYISQLPFTELKIDRSFVIDLDQSERNLTIVKTTIEMAKSLGLKIVAEGIETASIEAVLKQQDCHLVQGYYYQKPIAFEEYLSWLGKYKS